MQSRNTNYIGRLDHLRFFASGLVVLFHTWLMTGGRVRPGVLGIPLINQGHVGVQLFMVISGFILAVISYGKDLDAFRFYWNRILRIYPLFVFVLALGYFSTPDPRPATTVGDFLIALLPISNLARLQYGEFGGQLWSIAVELQFYLLFPLFQAILMRRGPRYHLCLIGFLIVLRTMVFSLHHTAHDLSYFSLFGSLDVFLAGHLCGWLYCQGKLKFRNPLWVLGAFAFLNILLWLAFRGGHFFHVPPAGYAGPPQSRSWLWIVWPDILAITFAVMIPAYIHCAVRIPLTKLWAACGRYSYSIYLWHILIIELAMRSHLGSINRYALGVIVLVTATLFAAASYEIIELPFLRRRVTYTKPIAADVMPAQG